MNFGWPLYSMQYDDKSSYLKDTFTQKYMSWYAYSRYRLKLKLLSLVFSLYIAQVMYNYIVKLFNQIYILLLDYDAIRLSNNI